MMDRVMELSRPVGIISGAKAPAEPGPAWFVSRKAQAEAAWHELPWPEAKDSRWRNSPVELFRDDAPRPAVAGRPALARVARDSKDDSAYAAVLRFVDGSLVKGTGSADLPRSISLGLGASGLPGQAPRTVDASDLADKLQARLWAESSQIVSIGLAEDCVLEKPILLEWVETGKAAYRAPLIFLSLGAGAAARFDLLWTSEGQGTGTFLSPAFRVDLGAGARLGLFELIDLDEASRFLDYPRANLAAGAELDWTRGFLGTGVVTSRLGAELEGRVSRFNLSSSWAIGSGRHLEAAVVQHHRGEGTWSRSRFEGAVDGDGRAICRGLIKVDKTAIGTDAYLSSRILALSPEARTVSLPELAIDTNDLTASHGSTVGSVGPDELFYLGTRGLSPAQAKALVAAGLLGGLLSRTPPELAGYVEARIEQVLEPAPIGASP